MFKVNLVILKIFSFYTLNRLELKKILHQNYKKYLTRQFFILA